MTKNVALARETLIQTLAFPEHHNQNKWLTEPNEKAIAEGDIFNCNTTACLAGTVLLLDAPKTALALFAYESTRDYAVYLTNRDLFNKSWEGMAAESLGVDENDVWDIFHTVAGDVEDDDGEEFYIGLKEANKLAIQKFADLFDLDLNELKKEARKVRKNYLARKRRAERKKKANG